MDSMYIDVDKVSHTKEDKSINSYFHKKVGNLMKPTIQWQNGYFYCNPNIGIMGFFFFDVFSKL